jgi:hypothetical protein
VLVIALSLAGFSSIALDEQVEFTAYHGLHSITSLAWLSLLLSQLVLIRRHRFERHRALGASIFFAGPVLVASLTLLTVHSAIRDAAAGREDMLVVQNVTFTLQVALLVFLAFILRRNRNVHGSLLKELANRVAVAPDHLVLLLERVLADDGGPDRPHQAADHVRRFHRSRACVRLGPDDLPGLALGGVEGRTGRPEAARCRHGAKRHLTGQQ